MAKSIHSLWLPCYLEIMFCGLLQYPCYIFISFFISTFAMIESSKLRSFCGASVNSNLWTWQDKSFPFSTFRCTQVSEHFGTVRLPTETKTCSQESNEQLLKFYGNCRSVHMLEKRQAPPNLHFQSLNPHIDLEDVLERPSFRNVSPIPTTRKHKL